MLNERHARAGGSGAGTSDRPESTSCALSLSGFWPGPLGLFTEPGQSDLARVPGALPEPGRRARPGRAATSGVPGTPAIFRWPEARAAFGQAPARAPRAGSATRARRPPGAGAAPGGGDQDDQRAQIKQLERRITTAIREHPDGQIFLSLFKKRQRDHGRGTVRGNRRLPRALPHPRRARWRRWPGGGRGRVRQTQGRLFPLGLQQAPALSVRAHSRTPAATRTRGRRTCTPPPSPAATTTPARSAGLRLTSRQRSGCFSCQS